MLARPPWQVDITNGIESAQNHFYRNGHAFIHIIYQKFDSSASHIDRLPILSNYPLHYLAQVNHPLPTAILRAYADSSCSAEIATLTLPVTALLPAKLESETLPMVKKTVRSEAQICKSVEVAFNANLRKTPNNTAVSN